MSANKDKVALRQSILELLRTGPKKTEDIAVACDISTAFAISACRSIRELVGHRTESGFLWIHIDSEIEVIRRATNGAASQFDKWLLTPRAIYRGQAPLYWLRRGERMFVLDVFERSQLGVDVAPVRTFGGSR